MKARPHISSSLFILLHLIAGWMNGHVLAQTADSFNPGASSSVYALATQPDGKILVGGWFSSIGGENRNRIARLNVDGSVDTLFDPNAGGTVYSIAVQADGKILVGGDFSSVGGLTRNRIARLHPDGSLDTSFNPDANNSVHSIVLQPDGKILVGGEFIRMGVRWINRIARLNSDGSTDTSFDPDANNAIHSIALQPDGKILLGGEFTRIGGQWHHRIARLNADGSVDTGFKPDANNSIHSMVVQPDGKILVGGDFTSIGGASRNHIARLNSDGSVDAGFHSGANGTVLSLTLQSDGKILAGGEFTTFAGMIRNRIARLNPDGSADTHFNPNANSAVRSLALLSDGKLLVGGSFTGIGGEHRRYIARLTNDPGSQSLIVTGSNQLNWHRSGSVPEVEQVRFDLWDGSGWVDVGTPIRVSGGWQLTGLSLPNSGWVRAGGHPFNGSGGWMEDVVRYGTEDFPQLHVTFGGNDPLGSGEGTIDFGPCQWNQPIPPQRITLTNTGDGVLENIDLVFEGSAASDYSAPLPETSLSPWASIEVDIFFTPQEMGARAASLKILSNDAEATPFFLALKGVHIHAENAFDPDVNSTVFALASQPDGKMLVGGSFTTIGGEPRNRMARLNRDGSLDASFDPGSNNSVYSLALQSDGKILVGGSFFSIDGENRSRIARLNPDGSVDTSFDPGATGTIYSLVPQPDGKILVGGNFTSIGGENRNRIARLNPDGTVDTAFDQNVNNTINSFALQPDGKILVGGSFTSIGGEDRNRIARLNPDGTVDTTFDPTANSAINSIALQSDGKVLVGGIFTDIAGENRNRIARLNADGSQDTNFHPDANGTVRSITLQSDGKILVGGDFSSIGGESRVRIARLNTDGSVDTGFNPGAIGTSINALALQSDGRVLVGGNFSTIGGLSRNSIARLTNDPGFQTLTVTGDSQIDWVRSGSVPEVDQVRFDLWNGSAWVDLGPAARVPGGWQCTGLSLPGSGWVRASGRTQGAYNNGSSGLVEEALQYGIGDFPHLQVTFEGEDPLVSGEGVVDFGIHEWNQPVPSRHITLTNAGEGVLEDISLVIEGGAASDYSFHLPHSSLAPGATMEVEVGFTPQEWGVRAASLKIYSNDAFAVPFFLALKGREIQAEAAFNPNAHDSVYTMIPQADGKILIGGSFRNIGASRQLYIARLNQNGSLDASFDPGANHSVSALVLQSDRKILVGGGFSTIGGATRNGFARLHPDGTLDTSFDPDAAFGVDSIVLQSDGKILVGGTFTAIGGASRNRIARLHPDGTLDATFDPNAGGHVMSFAQQSDGKILVGGAFTSIGGASRNRIARLNPDGTLDATFDPNAGGVVRSLALQSDGRILVSGDFTVIGGESRNRIARLHPDGSVDTSFDPGADGPINSIALQSDGKILLGGGFTTMGGESRSLIARLNPDGSLDTSFDPNANSFVYALALQSDGRILVGGAFSSIGGESRNRIARLFNDPGTQSLTVTGTHQLNWERSGSVPEVEHVRFDLWENGGWVDLGAADRIPGGWQLTELSLPSSGMLRAIGRTSAGYYNGSSGLEQELITYGDAAFLNLVLEDEASSPLQPGISTLTFQSLEVGLSTTRTMTIRNDGSMPVTGLTATFSGPQSNEFGLSESVSSDLAPEESLTLTVTYTPTMVGSANATLTLGDGHESFPISLQGQALEVTYPQLVMEQPADVVLPSGSAYSFGVGLSGEMIVRPFTLRNLGNEALGIEGISLGESGDFRLNLETMVTNLGPDETTTLLVTFTPGDPGPRSTYLSIISNDFMDEYELLLEGEGNSSPQLTVLPGAHINFTFQGSPGNTYLVQRSEDLGTWVTVATLEADSTGKVSFIDEEPPEPLAFYRLALP